MEYSGRTLQINAVYAVCALAFLRIPLKEAGFCMEEGVILVLQNTALFELVISELLRYNAKKVRLRINGKIDAWNFHLVFTIYDQAYKHIALHEFMRRSEFLPMILVRGVVPPELRDFKNIIIVDDYNTSLQGMLWRTEDFSAFTEHVTANVDGIVQELKFLRKAKESADRNWFSDVPNAIGAVLSLICDHIHEQYHFDAADYRINNELIALGEVMRSAFYRGDTDLDLVGAVCRSISNYLDQKKEKILVGAEDQPEMEFWMAFEAHEAIVFDSDFYYMDDAVFKAGTYELHEVISNNRLKMELCAEGVLVCNAGCSEGYTVKKQFYQPDGTLIRPRVIKLSREKLDGVFHPDIVARRWKACTSVSII